jgi:signal transduction histidine kinase
MSDDKSNPLPEMPSESIDSDSHWASFIWGVGILVLITTALFFLGVITDGIRVDDAGDIIWQLFIAGIQLLVISHLIKILANIRWFTYKTSEKSSSGTIDSSLFSGVIEELKKISEQNKEQSEALKKSIEELSEKAEKTNTYLYHIYKK